MKQNWFLAAMLLLFTNTANALIVSIDGYGDVPEEGLFLTVTDAEEDFLSGEMQMTLEGNLLCSTPLTVTIKRATAGLTDEFCCAGACTAGNGALSETLHFNPNGLANWYVHYMPADMSDQTIVYTFADETETRTITVRYAYGVDITTPDQRLIVHLRTGENVIFDLNETPVTTFENNYLVITSSTTKVMYPIEDVATYTFEGIVIPEAIESVRPNTLLIRMTNEQVTIKGLKEQAVVELFTVNGQPLVSMQATAGQTVVPLHAYPAGIYIINAGDVSYKFVKQ